MKNRKLKLLSLVMVSALAAGVVSPISARAEEAVGEWREEDGNKYWYESGVKQGTEGRGKEIYDPASDAWYWLDSVDGGKMAVSKDVYQESKAGQWGDYIGHDGERYGKWVRYDENGRMIKGWSENKDGRFYFDYKYGTMAKGYATIENSEYYFNAERGVLERNLGEVPEFGWKTINGNDYWYEDYVRQGCSIDPKYRGKEIYDPDSDAWYWLDNVDGGKKAVSKDVYQESMAGQWGDYIGQDGERYGKWVRYDADGHMVKSWSTNENGTYYFDPKYGTMAKGSVVIEGKTYIFDEKTGILQGDDTSNKNESTGVGTSYHTQEEIKEYMASSGASVNNQTKMQTDPNLSAPYDKGSVTEESLRDALVMLNQIRYIAGLDYNVTLDDEYTELAQAGAFVNAVNNKMTHTPDRPSGMSDALYEDAFQGAGSSNLAYSTARKSLSYFITLWMDDSDAYNIDRIGHRRWILNPVMSKTGFGYAKSDKGWHYSSVYVFDNVWAGTDVQGVAWPAREMPVEYFSDNMAWSYSYGKSLSDVTVTLTCLNEGSDQKWYFSEIGYTSAGYFNVENSNYGQKGCVIFRPDGIHIQAGGKYHVIIEQDGTELANYTVNFF